MTDDLRILIVEDDPDDRELIHLILKKALPNVVLKSTLDFDEYRREVSSGQYDIVLTDYNIGDFTGFDVVNFIREKQLDVPVILITGEHAMDTALDAIRLQVDDYVVKNFKYAKRLPRIIERVLKNSPIEQAKRTTHESLNNLITDYDDIFDNTTELILSLWPDGSILNVNRAWIDTLGYSKEEIAQLNIHDLVAVEYKDRFQQIMHGLTQGRGNIEIKLCLNSKSGKKIYIEGNASSRLVSGRSVASHWIMKDVTHAREIEKLLWQTNDQYLSAFEYAPNPMVLADHRGRTLQINRAACDLIGYSYDEMIGTHIRDITHPDDLPESQEQLRKLLSGEIDSYTVEKRYRHKSGKYIRVEASASLVRNDNGLPRFVIAQFKELGDRPDANGETPDTLTEAG